MKGFLLLCTLLLTPSSAIVETEGVLELRRSPAGVEVLLRTGSADRPDDQILWNLKGSAMVDLRKLQSATIRVRGAVDGKKMKVESYDLLSVYGRTPIVGQITEISGKIAIVDGAGPPILLNLAPRSYRRFLDAQGQRSWVTGELLLSGELKVGRYGIFEKPPIEKQDPPAGNTKDLK